MLETIDNLHTILMTAHEDDSEACTVTPRRLLDLVDAVSCWADNEGWTYAPQLGTATSPDRRYVISGGGGELTVVRDGRTLTYPTSSIIESVDLLVLTGAVPARFSSNARATLDQLADVCEGNSTHISTRYPMARQDAARVWREAASLARGFVDHTMTPVAAR